MYLVGTSEILQWCAVFFVFFLFFFLLFCFFFFFFKQKTAYEIYQCDWSSDVCSSDLWSWCIRFPATKELKKPYYWLPHCPKHPVCSQDLLFQCPHYYHLLLQQQIGRASCRERVQISVVAVSLKKKKKKEKRKKNNKKINKKNKKKTHYKVTTICTTTVW